MAQKYQSSETYNDEFNNLQKLFNHRRFSATVNLGALSGRVPPSPNRSCLGCYFPGYTWREPCKRPFDRRPKSWLVLDSLRDSLTGLIEAPVFQIPIRPMRVQGSQIPLDRPAQFRWQCAHGQPFFKHALLLPELHFRFVPWPDRRTRRRGISIRSNKQLVYVGNGSYQRQPKMEIAILHEGYVGSKAANLSGQVSPDQQTGDPKAGKRFRE